MNNGRFFLLHHLLFDNGIHWKSGIKMFGDAELPSGSGQLKILFSRRDSSNQRLKSFFCTTREELI
jgi:hypothetical protein